MKWTGQTLYQKWIQNTGSAYTGYVSPAIWNNLIEEALFQYIEEMYKKPQDQQERDFATSFIATNVKVTSLGNNSLNIRPIVITNIVNTSSTNWTLETNIPFAPVTLPAQIDIKGASGFTNNPNGQFPIVSFGTSVKGTVIINFTAPAKGSGSYIVNSGMFSFQNIGNTVPAQLIDYLHVLNIKCKFTKPIYMPLVTNSTNTTPITCTVNWYNNLRSSSEKNNVLVSMEGWATNTNANGNFYIKKINDLNFQLYSDINLQDPVAGISNEANTDISFGMTYYNAAKPYLSTEKISNQNLPTAKSPRYENTNNTLLIYGDPLLNLVCTEVTIDYLRQPQFYEAYSYNNDAYSGIYIDSGDNNFDLTTIYAENMLFRALKYLTDIVAMSIRDGSLIQFNQIQEGR